MRLSIDQYIQYIGYMEIGRHYPIRFFCVCVWTNIAVRRSGTISKGSLECDSKCFASMTQSLAWTVKFFLVSSRSSRRFFRFHSLSRSFVALAFIFGLFVYRSNEIKSEISEALWRCMYFRVYFGSRLRVTLNLFNHSIPFCEIIII